MMERTSSFATAMALAGLMAMVVQVPGASGGPQDDFRKAVDFEPRVILRWQATHEEGAYGYNIYRAFRRQGPFRRINAEILHVGEAGAVIASYEHFDFDVEPGKTYFYYLDLVSTTGHKQRFSGVIKKTVSDVYDSPNR